ncbi:hypothetical protein Taro_042486 [Colocasia esculenta]|uniref:AAA+ ATPase domain-containing protein n=1 Tax=Colocasia esculenta TaxID=4460 RepID=A0A843WYM9_COLES|nr:hypothetical protein [Colocasia esculenta]
MPLLACILPVLTFLCQPVLGAVETCVGNQAQRFFGFLTDWADGLFGDRPNAAEEVPESASEVVGAEDTLSVIRSYLNDDSVGIIGIYGMGGVGKTTILQRINNEFFESGKQGSFDLVIWVTVSQTVDIPAIQKQIAERLGLSLSCSNTEEDARVLFKALSDKRFLVLLDDIWRAIDMQVEIGIPRPKGRRRNSKIVFTTRLSQVCDEMEAKSIPVKPLDEVASWELFSSKLRTQEVCTNPTIRLLAEQVAHKCGGLPLALVTVAKAMANRKLSRDWEDAVDALDHRPERLDDQVLRCLKFSFDYLKNDNMRSALLFCSMFPEDAQISREKLVDYWVGEGLVDDENDGGEGSMNDARGAGQALINKLLDACLLESSWSSLIGPTVKMHDAVRDMVLWINRHEYNKVDGFLAWDSIIRREDRKHIKRIRLLRKHIKRFNPDVILSCSSNRTLMLSSVRGLRPPILQGIASSMKSTLRILDLFYSDIRGELPAEVGLMAELRFLDLSFTRIASLPKELGNLVKLRQLGLVDTKFLVQIPQEAIAGLRSLQVLNMTESGYDWEADPRGGEDGGRQLKLGDLEAAGLPRLEELGVQLDTPRALERFLKSDKLCSRTRSLRVKMRHRSQSEDPPLYGEGGSLLWRVFSRMGRSLKTLFLYGDDAHPWEGGLRISLDQLPLLEFLRLDSFRSERMPEVVLVGSNFTPRSSSNIVRLSSFVMDNCDGQKGLKLVGAFPCLRNIVLGNCSTMEELALDDGVAAGIAEEGTQDDAGLLDCHLPMLSDILLYKLPSLKSIGRRPLRLPELRYIKVDRCPELRRIPLDAAGMPKLERIRARREWWDTVECAGSGGHNTKPIFEKRFIEL